MTHIDLIKRFEGFKPAPYLDQAGIATIGFGTTRITEAEAEWLLESYLDRAVIPFIRGHIKVPLNDNQFGALLSFLYNVSISQFKDSESLKILNSGDYNTFADRLLLWNKVRDGKGKLTVSNGLTNRRKAERELFLKPEEN